MDERRGKDSLSLFDPREAALSPSAPALAVVPAQAPRVLSVSQLGRMLRTDLEARTAGIEVGGEVTGLKEVSSGHAYFTLRDEREEAAIDCVMYRTAPVRARRLLSEGARLVLRGRVTFYAPRGRVQLVVDGARPVGRGALLEALEKLKAKLAEEGLFAPERKRPLPADPRVIGVVTSAQGAALHDVVKVAFRRSRVRLVLAPAPVQGPGAGEALARALRLIARHPEVEAVILGRGGGSTDDLAAFNEEALVRAVAACPVPVISAVGHETDVTLVDLAADVRAATPSQAAEILIPDARARLAHVRQLRARLDRSIRLELDERLERLDDARASLEALAGRHLTRRREALAKIERRLAARHPAAVLSSARVSAAALQKRLLASIARHVAPARARVPDLSHRLVAATRIVLAQSRSTLGQRAARLHALSPLAVLGRGYAIVRTPHGKVLVSARDASPGDALDVRLAEGTLAVVVERVKDS